MKEKCKSLFETNGIFYYLLKNGNTQGEICKILNITRRKILKGISKFFPDSSFQNFAQIKNMGLSFNENKIIESKSLKLYLIKLLYLIISQIQIFIVNLKPIIKI